MNPLNPAFVAPAGMYVHHYGNSAADYAAGSVKENNKNTKAENNNVIVAKPVAVNEPPKKVAAQKKTNEVKKEPVVSKPAPATVESNTWATLVSLFIKRVSSHFIGDSGKNSSSFLLGSSLVSKKFSQLYNATVIEDFD